MITFQLLQPLQVIDNNWFLFECLKLDTDNNTVTHGTIQAANSGNIAELSFESDEE